MNLRLLLHSAAFGLLMNLWSAVVATDVVSEVRIETNGTCQIQWPAASGPYYTVQTSSDMKTWEDKAGYLMSSVGDMLSYEFRPQAAPAFYKIVWNDTQEFNLPLPASGLRMESYEELDGPKWPANYGEGHVTLWHDGKFSAYSITIDDNNTPDIPFWLETAEHYGWRLTWFVIIHPVVWDIYNDVPGINQNYFGTLEEWKDVHDLGHDVQLHGSCAYTNDLTQEGYDDHISRSIKVLEGATGGKILTFAYPCGVIQNGEYDYHAVISKYMIGARGTKGGVTPAHLVDYLETKSLGSNPLTNGEPGNAFSRYTNKRDFRYSAYRGWCVTLYHHVDDAARVKVLETLDWVKAHEDEFWVAAFTDVAKYAQERETATLEIESATSDEIVLNVRDEMEDLIFDHPLTVKIRVDDSWSEVAAVQNGLPIKAYIVGHEDGTFLYVQPVPDRGKVRITKG